MEKKQTERSDFAQSHLISSILLLFRQGNEHLRDFLFHHQELRLRDTPKELLKEARAFSRGEQILIRVALDFWSDSGSARFSEIIEHLEHENILNLLRSILRLREMDLSVQLVEEPSCCD